MSGGNRGFRRTNKTPGGYKNEPSGRVHMYDKIYVGFVKDNRDAIKMGRLKVWIPELSPGDPSDHARWYTVNYCTPFGGATRATLLKKDSKNPDDTQQSYGFWAVPPDLDNEVIVLFINGDPNRGIWIGSLYQQFMNQMIPGLASNTAFDENFTGDIKPPPDGINPPVKEYNKRSEEAASETPHRPIFAPLHEGLFNEGLYVDGVRGPATASARRSDAYNPQSTDLQDIVAAENTSGATIPGTVDPKTGKVVNPTENNGDSPATTPAINPAGPAARVTTPTANPASPGTPIANPGAPPVVGPRLANPTMKDAAPPATDPKNATPRPGTATAGNPNGSANPGTQPAPAQPGQNNSSTDNKEDPGDPPALVYGLISPKGNHMYIDDAGDGMIRIRTRHGAQIMINDNVGYIYMISRNGNSWMEISDDGIDMYSSKNISMRSHGDINMHADANINMYAAGTLNQVAQTGGTGSFHGGFNLQTDQLNLTSSGSVNIYSPKRVSISGPSVGIAATGDIGITAGGALGITSTGALSLSGAPVTTNKGLGPQAMVEPIEPVQFSAPSGTSGSGSSGGGDGGGGGGGATDSSTAVPVLPSPGSAGADKTKRAMDYLMGQGWTKEQAAGIVGNLLVESGKSLNEKAVGDHGSAYGLAQWHADRQANFQRKFGHSIQQGTFDEQLAFVNHELKYGTEQGAGNKLKQATSAGQAAAIVDQYYERSSGAARGQRIANANALAQGQYSADPGVKASNTPTGDQTIDPNNPTPGLESASQPPEPNNVGRYISGPLSAETPTPDVLNDRMLDVDAQYPECATYTIVSRLVTHEPFNLHPNAPTDPALGPIPSSTPVQPEGASGQTAKPNQNIPITDDGTAWVYPTSGLGGSQFGMRFHPIEHRMKMHTGIDIHHTPVGTPIVAAKEGTVSFAGWKGGYGNCTIIKHANGISTFYAHQSAIFVKPGDQVKAGQRIGSVGSTGMSTGPHLHFEVRVNDKPVNPLQVLPAMTEGATVTAGKRAN